MGELYKSNLLERENIDNLDIQDESIIKKFLETPKGQEMIFSVLSEKLICNRNIADELRERIKKGVSIESGNSIYDFQEDIATIFKNNSKFSEDDLSSSSKK